MNYLQSWLPVSLKRRVDRLARVAKIYRDRRRLKRAAAFDSEWYLDQYPDVRQARQDPVLHYLRWGASEGRNPSSRFNTMFYLSRNRDVVKAGVNPLVHYLTHGKEEGRLPAPFVDSRDGRTKLGGLVDYNVSTYDDSAFMERIDSLYGARPDLFDRIKVSIVMPAYNRADMVEDAIRSVQGQSHSNWELIVIDDGSTDGTDALVHQYVLSDARVTLLSCDHRGVSAARNAGLRQATGEIIAYLDTDNTWRASFLRTMVVFMKSDDHECAYSAQLVVDETGAATHLRGEEFDWDKCLRGNFVDLNAYCHLRDIPGIELAFDERLRRMVDWDLILRQTRGRRVGYAAFIGSQYFHSELSDRITNNEKLVFGQIVRLKNSQSPPLGPEAIAAKLALNIAIKISAPRSKRLEWGDFHYAESFATALEKLGHTVRIDFLEEWYDSSLGADDVTIVLRGLSEYFPRKGHVNILWNISHPDQIAYEEYDGFDLVYVASNSYAAFLRGVAKSPVKPLLQATDRSRFHPVETAVRGDHPGVLFVGNSRNEYRPIVKWAVDEGLPLDVFGTLWSQYIPKQFIKGENVNNSDLGRLYASADFVLNDHWASMRDFGFLSNRLFDAVGSGARVISDRVPSIDFVFGDVVSQVDSAAELAAEVRRADPQSTSVRRAMGDAIVSEHNFDRRAREVVDDVLEFLNLPAPSNESGETPEAISSPSLLKKKPLRVASIVQWSENGPQSSAFIRLLCPLTAEIMAGRVDAELMPAKQVVRALDADIVIVQRTAFDDLDSAQQFQGKLGKSAKLIVDIDDAFCWIDETHPEHAIYREKAAALDHLMQCSATNWFSTEGLAQAYSGTTSKAEIMPNMIDPRIWRNYRIPRPAVGQSERLEMLYMGTATHDADFQLVLPALETLAREYPGAFALTIIGAVRNPARHSWITKINPPTNSTSYPRFARWLLEQKAFDIGLAPLVANRFNDCKSDLKILDYGAMGIVPIVSDGRTYRETARSSGAAVLVQNDVAGWTECLREILRNRAQLPEVAEAAHDYVWEARDVSRLARLQMESIERLV